MSSDEVYQPLDFARAVQFFTLDAITDLAFGKPFGFLTRDEDVHNWIATELAVFPAMNFLAVFPWIHPILRPKFMQRYVVHKEKNRQGFEKLKE